MTDTRHALVLALAMGAVGLVQGQASQSGAARCSSGGGQAASPGTGRVDAAKHAADPGSGRCTAIARAASHHAARP
jgi:hypothetical protein